MEKDKEIDMKKKTFHAWGIDLSTSDSGALAGRYWWFHEPGNFPVIPQHLEGCRTALFKTRKIARENLKYAKSPHLPKARVVKVNVTLEWE